MILSNPINGHNGQCDGCGTTFKRKASNLTRSDKHWCSRPCRDSFMKSQNMIKCDQCAVEFYKVKSHANRSDVNFCSRKCNAMYHTGENHKAHDPDMDRHCVGCGSFIKRCTSKRKYCSRRCASKGNTGEGNARYSKTVIKCSECGNDTIRTPAVTYKTTFCSPNCQNTYHSKRISGENNPRYYKGHFVGKTYSKAGLYIGFTAALKDEIRERDGRVCQICSRPESEFSQALHVHHIDWNKSNQDKSNLISLCKYCHIGKCHGKNKEKWQKILLRRLQS